MREQYISEVLSKKEEDHVTNSVYLLGEFVGIEEEGVHDGVDHYICLFKTGRGDNKPLYTWVLLPKHARSLDYIRSCRLIYVEGEMYSSYSFNDKASVHTFVLALSVNEVEEDVLEIEKHREFYMNYTMNNRVVLVGEVNTTPWREYIEPVDSSVTRFSVRYRAKGKDRTIYCTLWDTVNDLDNLSEGDRVRVVGSFNLLKKERGLVVDGDYVVESRKNKLDSYVIVVQKIEILSEERLDEKAEEIFGGE